VQTPSQEKKKKRTVPKEAKKVSFIEGEILFSSSKKSRKLASFNLSGWGFSFLSSLNEKRGSKRSEISPPRGVLFGERESLSEE